MKMLKRLFIWFLLLPMAACIDPYKVELPEGERLLTVEGYITTDPGPHTIKLTRTDTYGSVFEGLIRPVTQATVAVRDSQGRVTFLTEIDQGVYQTPDEFRAVVGLSYSLQIQLQDGKTYNSLPERVSQVPPISDLTYRAVQVATDNRLLDNVGVQVFSEFTDPSDEQNFYYWRLRSGTFQVIANPELYTLPPNHPTNPRGPAPKECCNTCYVGDASRIQRFAIASDADFNGLRNRLPVLYIEDNGLRFKGTYRAEIEQMSISAGAHRFLKLVEQQLSLTGSVFDQPPATIRGNIISLDNPDEVVLGYFMAAGVDRRFLYIQGNQLEFRATPRIIADDCRIVEGATLDPPANWNPPRD